MRKTSVERSFAPDYVSAETLAYRLDCSRSTVDEYVRRGFLPSPKNVGNLLRWRWSEIEAWIAKQGSAGNQLLSPNGDADDDPYSLGVKRVTASDT